LCAPILRGFQATVDSGGPNRQESGRIYRVHAAIPLVAGGTLAGTGIPHPKVARCFPGPQCPIAIPACATTLSTPLCASPMFLELLRAATHPVHGAEAEVSGLIISAIEMHKHELAPSRESQSRRPPLFCASYSSTNAQMGVVNP
jgi:hypothetical protein